VNYPWQNALSSLTFQATSWVKTEKGEENLRFVDSQGSFDLHDPKGADLEANLWFSSINAHGLGALFVFGVGLGYYYRAAKKWLEKNPGAYLVFLEQNLEVIARLCETDLGKELINHPQVRLIYLDPDLSPSQAIPRYLFSISSEVQVLKSYEVRYPRECQALVSIIKHMIEAYQTEKQEFFSHGLGFYKNFYRNLSMLAKSYRGNALFNKFEGIPAIICGAGPSLEKNLALLETLKDRALIFAGGSAMNAVSKNGFLPHFGVGIDPNLAQAFRLGTNSGFLVPYFYRSRMYHEAVKIIHGDLLYITGSGGYRLPRWFEEKLEIDSPFIPEGGNVVNFSMSIAKSLGCNPIILVGLDLSYTDQSSYASGIVRFPLATGKESLQTKSEQDELLATKDIHGEPILTLWKWIYESQFFSEFAKKHPELVLINATEGGIGMEGIPNKTLQEVKQEYLKKKYPFQKMVHDAIQQAKMPPAVTAKEIISLMKEFKESLDKVADSLQSKKEICVKEPAWEFFLKDFDEFYKRYRGKGEGEELNEQEAVEQNQLLCNVSKTNQSLIQTALSAMVEQEVYRGKKPKKGVDNLYYESGALYATYSKKDKIHHFYYEDGAPRADLPISDGKLNGEVLLYYPSGKKKRKVTFLNGIRAGKEEWWFPSGVLQCEWEYQNNHPVGEAKLYYFTASLKQKVVYNQDGEFILAEQFLPSGESIPFGEDASFFSKIVQETGKIQNALSVVMEKMNDWAPLLSSKGEPDPDLKEIQQELEKLNLLEKKLHQEEKIEPLWKTPTSKRLLGKQMEQVAKEMGDQLEQIQTLLQKFKKNNSG
jgi:hypothetical protein